MFCKTLVVIPFTAPEQAASLAVFYQQNPNSTSGFIIGDMSIRRAASAELIVGGAITANKLAANSVHTNHLAAGSVCAEKMQVGTITAASGILANASVTTATIKHAAVETLTVAGEVVTTLRASSSRSVLDIGSLDWVNILTVYSPGGDAGGRLLQGSLVSRETRGFDARVVRDGVVVADVDITTAAFPYDNHVGAVIDGFIGSFSIFETNLDSATYAIQVKRHTAGGSNRVLIHDRSLSVMTAKR